MGQILDMFWLRGFELLGTLWLSLALKAPDIGGISIVAGGPVTNADLRSNSIGRGTWSLGKSGLIDHVQICGWMQRVSVCKFYLISEHHFPLCQGRCQLAMDAMPQSELVLSMAMAEPFAARCWVQPTVEAGTSWTELGGSRLWDRTPNPELPVLRYGGLTG